MQESARAAHKEAPQAVSGNKTDFRRLLETLPAGAYTCDAEGLITYFNARAVDVWGRSPKLNDPVDRFCGSFRLFARDGTPITHDQCWMAKALREGKEYVGEEIVIERPDGSRRTALAHANPFRDESGRVMGAVNVLIDITERKQAEDEHALLTAIVESSDDAIYSRSVEGRILSWNSGAERLYGYTAQEAIGAPVTLLIPREKQAEEEANMGRVWRGELVEAYESVRVTKHGRRVDVAMRISPIRDAGGQIVGASKVVRDITARRRSETALRESEQRFSKFMQHLPGLAWIKDLEGRYVFVNDAAERAFRLPREKLLGKRDAEVFPAETAARFYENDQKAAVSGTGVETVETLEHDDGVHYSVVHKFPIAGPDGKPALVGGMAIDFTERLRAEEALRFSEERFRTLASHAPVGIFVTDLFGNCSFVNERWCEMAGMTSEAARGKGWMNAIHPEDRGRIEREWSEAMRNRTPFVAENRFLRPDGTVTWLQGTAAELLDATGAMTGYIGTIVDLTEQKRVEDALRVARNQLKMVTDTMSAAVTQCSADRRYVWVSRGYAAWVGRQQEEIAGRPIAEILGEEGYETIRPYVERVLTGEKVEYEALLKYKDSGPRWIHAAYVPTYGNGEVPDGWVAVVSDITRLKEVEAELAGQLADLRRLHEMTVRLSTTLELQPILEETLRTATALIGTDMGLLSLADPENNHLCVRASLGFTEEFLATIEHVSPGVGACGKCYENRIRVIVEDVESSPLYDQYREAAREAGFRAVHNTPLVTRGGKIVGVLSAHFRKPHRPSDREIHLVDLCARQAVDYIENAQLYEELREADRRKDEFLATLAHELRNPLAPISNSLHILRLSEDLSPSAERVREIMERQVNHMVRLVDDLLEVSRITRGKIELRKEAVEAAAVVRSAVEASRPLIDDAGHQLAITLPSEPLTIDGDPLRLAQVITNLLNNAAKYMEKRGQIWVTARREGGDAVISVRDAGVGIPPNLLPRVFDMFAQVDGSLKRAQGGLGIGLTLAQRLMHMHGGRIEAFSEGLGKGSEFVVRAPLHVEAMRATASIAESPSERKPLPSYRVLVVDDTRAAVYTMARLLETLGQHVRCAHDAAEALESVQTERPDLVISDIAMPTMDGYELAFRLRQDPRMEGVMLVALTGYGQESHREKAKAAGFDHHLVKPVSVEGLEELLSSLAKPEAASARTE